MNSSDNVGVTFVNTVIGRGALNNVINLSFGVFQFTPNDQTGQVDLDTAVACRLRMDKACAVQLRDVMNQLLAAIEKVEEPAGSEPPKSNGLIPKADRVKIN